MTATVKRHLYRTATGVAVFLTIAAVFVVVVGLRVHNVQMPPRLGNRPEVLESIQADTDPNEFTFIVTGDVKRGTATLGHLLRLAKADNAAFVAINGDFVSNGEYRRHRLFIRKMADMGLKVPVLLVPGNHDMAPDMEFTDADYRKVYGATQFEFVVGSNLFVVLANAPPYDADRGPETFLEQAVAKHAGKINRIFVFMHVPVSQVNSQISARAFAGSAAFPSLAKKLNVTYVFCGDHHGYVKTVKDGTTYIVCGGGGDKLRGRHGRFHHVMRIGIQDGDVTETVIACERQFEVIKHLERHAAVHFWPAMTSGPVAIVISCLTLGAIAAFLLFALRGLSRCRRQMRQARDGR